MEFFISLQKKKMLINLGLIEKIWDKLTNGILNFLFFQLFDKILINSVFLLFLMLFKLYFTSMQIIVNSNFKHTSNNLSLLVSIGRFNLSLKNKREMKKKSSIILFYTLSYE